MNDLKDRRQLAEEWIRRLLTYTSSVTWFGPSSLMRAWAFATGGLAETAVQQFVAMLRRTSLLAAAGQFLTDLAAERGATRFGAARAKVFVVVQPFVANVTAITINGGGAGVDAIEVDDSSGFTVAMSIRIRNGDGSTSETKIITTISAGTGPNSGDELYVSTLIATYTPLTDDVDVLARVLVTTDSTLTSTTGPAFQLLSAITTGDANPVLDGESGTLALADKAWAEAIAAGTDGNVDPLTVTGLATPLAGIVSIYNPEPGTGGTDGETDLDLKYRAINRATIANQETLAWLEALAKEANNDVLRAVRVTSTSAGVMAVKVLHRNGGTFFALQLTEIEDYLDARVRSYMTTSVVNLTLTSVEVEAEITLDPDVSLETVFKRASRRLSEFLDFRKWAFGQLVDEADLAAIVVQTPGVASMVTATFLPASDVVVASDSLPTLVRLSLRDTVSNTTINATLAQSF